MIPEYHFAQLRVLLISAAAACRAAGLHSRCVKEISHRWGEVVAPSGGCNSSRQRTP